MENKIEYPHVLYHYCSVESFFYIIKNKSLWLSDISKSNDSKELKGILEKCFTYLLDLIGEYQRSSKKCDINDDDNKKMFAEARNLVRFYINQESEKYWVLCLSEKEDDLGQWRGYSQDASGIAIGLKVDFLARLVGDNNIADCSEKLHFDKISYFKQFDEKKIFDSLHNGISIADMNKDDFYSLIKKIIVFSLVYAPYFKSDCFKDESEWRLAYKMSCNELHAGRTPLIKNEHLSSKYEYSLIRGKLISHLELILSNPTEAIASIWLGPKCTLSEREVKLFLISNGYLKNIEDESIKIHTSNATYR